VTNAPPWLILDTSADEIAVALAAGGELRATLRHRPSGPLSEHLRPALEHLLDAEDVALGDLGGVAVARGPGSFTGLRVGLAFGLGLAESLGIPAHGLSCLDALAEGFAVERPATDGTIAAVVPTSARRADAYVRSYRVVSGRVEPLGPARVAAGTELEASLAAVDQVVGRVPGRASAGTPQLAGLARCLELVRSGAAAAEPLFPEYILPPPPIATR